MIRDLCHYLQSQEIFKEHNDGYITLKDYAVVMTQGEIGGSGEFKERGNPSTYENVS